MTRSRPHPQRTAQLTALACVLVVAGLLAAPPLRNVDWGWQLQTGQRILDERTVDLPDEFSVGGAGRSIPPVHWLYEVLLALVYRAGGIPGLASARVALVMALYTLLFTLATRQGMPPWIAAAATSAAAAASWMKLILRPHLISFLFTVAVVGLLLEARRRPRLLLLVPPLFVVWANCHPGAILGLGVLGAFAAGEALELVLPLRRGEADAHAHRKLATLAGLVALSALATCASPSGFDLWAWMWEHGTMFEGAGNFELRPLDITSSTDQLHLATTAALLLLGGRLWRDPACCFATGFYALLTLRTVRFFPHVDHLLVLAAAAAWQSRSNSLGWRWARAAGIAALAAIAAWGAFDAARAPHPLLHPIVHPAGAADFVLANDTPEPLYNTQRLGGYLVYRFAGRRPVFWDGRTSLYEHLWRLDWSELDARFHFGTVLLAEYSPPVAPELPGAEQRWRLVYFDDTARVYVDVHADGGAWAERGFREVRLQWSRVTPESVGLVPVIRDPVAALAELEPQRAKDPEGYYTNLALARTYLALGRAESAQAAAERAIAARETPAARQAREAALRIDSRTP